MADEDAGDDETVPERARRTLALAARARPDAEARARIAASLGPLLAPGGASGAPPAPSSGGGVGGSPRATGAGGALVAPVAIIVALTMIVVVVVGRMSREGSPGASATGGATPADAAEDRPMVRAAPVGPEEAGALDQRSTIDREEVGTIDRAAGAATDRASRRAHDVTAEGTTLERVADDRAAVRDRAADVARATAPSRDPEVAPAPAAPTELALLHEARRLLRSDVGRALEVLATHAELYPRGSFSEEREVLAVEALARGGRMREARARAHAFVSAHPLTAHRSRLEQLVGALDPSG